MSAEGGNGLAAATVAAGALADVQMRLPVHPRLVLGVAFVDLPDGSLLIEGTATRQVLRGQAVGLVRQLRPALERGGTIEAIAASAPGTPAYAVFQAVAMLHAVGAIEEAWEEPAGWDAVDRRTACFLSRRVDSTRANAHAVEAMNRLQDACIWVAGPLPLAKVLVAALADLRIEAHAVDVAALAGEAPRGVRVVWLQPDRIEHDTLLALDDAMAARGRVWQRVQIGGETVEIGPLFDRRYNPCAACCLAGGAPLPDDPPADDLWASLVALDLFHQVTRVNRPLAYRRVSRLDLGGAASPPRLVHPRLGCSRCFPLSVGIDVDPRAFVYERMVAFPPKDELSPKDHQVHYLAANLRLQKECRDLAGARPLALPGLHPGDPVAGSAVDALSVLLRGCAGVSAERGSQVDRYAPTGGNLGSVEAWVLAIALPGVPAGIHLYHPFAHDLREAVRLDEGAARALAHRLVGDDAGSALIVTTGALSRVAAKYHDFALRILCLDAGVAHAQLARLAADLGLRSRLCERWDDAVFDAATGGAAELVTGVAVLHHGSSRAHP